MIVMMSFNLERERERERERCKEGQMGLKILITGGNKMGIIMVLGEEEPFSFTTLSWIFPLFFSFDSLFRGSEKRREKER